MQENASDVILMMEFVCNNPNKHNNLLLYMRHLPDSME